MSNDSQNANSYELELSSEVTVKNIDLTNIKKEDEQDEKKDVVKLIMNGTLSEVMSDSLLKDDDLKLMTGKTTIFEIKRKEDVNEFQSYLNEDGIIDEVVILLPTNEALGDFLSPILHFASIKDIPVVKRKDT